MFKVPFFTIANYKEIMSKKYSELDKSDRQDIGQILFFVQNNIKKYQNIDPRKLRGDEDKMLIASKLLIPTLRNSNYFSWNQSNGEHFGLDIILPSETPIIARESGIVTKIKLRDGSKKDEGNSITIKGSDCYRSYEHCHHIVVQNGRYVTKGQIIGTVGKTGNSTQYHIHLQCDLFSAPFVPYWSDQNLNIKKYTLDPLPIIINLLDNNNIFKDMPSSTDYSNPILKLYNLGILKGKDSMIYPEDFIQRYEFALMIHRLIQGKPEITKNILTVVDGDVNYIDILMYGQELLDALFVLKKYKIMTGFNNQFLPDKKIKGQELLAVCGRLFFGIADANFNIRYSTYTKFFIEKGIIDSDRHYIGEPVPRKEVFRIISNFI